MAKTRQSPGGRWAPSAPDPDLLAAVVLDTLVSRAGGDAGPRQDADTGSRQGGDAGRGASGDARRGRSDEDTGMTLAEIAVACERDPANAADRGEVEQALAILRADELASHHGELWRATRAAIRAAELSF